MLRAVEEEEAKLRAKKLQESECDVQKSETTESSGSSDDVCKEEKIENLEEDERGSKLETVIESDLLISRVVDDDEDSIDRELKGLD